MAPNIEPRADMNMTEEEVPSWTQKVEKEEAGDTRKQPWRELTCDEGSVPGAARTEKGLRDLIGKADLHKVAG